MALFCYEQKYNGLPTLVQLHELIVELMNDLKINLIFQSYF